MYKQINYVVLDSLMSMIERNGRPVVMEFPVGPFLIAKHRDAPNAHEKYLYLSLRTGIGYSPSEVQLIYDWKKEPWALGEVYELHISPMNNTVYGFSEGRCFYSQGNRAVYLFKHNNRLLVHDLNAGTYTYSDPIAVGVTRTEIRVDLKVRAI